MYKITNEEFTKLVVASKSWAELARRCGVTMSPSGYISKNIRNDLKMKVKILGLDTSHFVRLGWSGSTQNIYKMKSNSQIFVKDRRHNGVSIKKILFERGWKNECASCKNVHFVDQDGMLTWQGKEVRLQIEHRNGVHSDNRIENLELLCQLCHSQTSTFAGGNKSTNREKLKSTREKIDDDELTKRIRECKSWTKVCTFSGRPYNSVYALEFRRRAKALGLDFSHFLAWGNSVPIPDADYFAPNTKRGAIRTKHRLFDFGWKNECAGCKNSSFVDVDGIPHWMDKEIVLQVEHRNGVHTDNRIENLELLCYLCHSHTDTFSAKNQKTVIAKRKWLSDGI